MNILCTFRIFMYGYVTMLAILKVKTCKVAEAYLGKIVTFAKLCSTLLKNLFEAGKSGYFGDAILN